MSQGEASAPVRIELFNQCFYRISTGIKINISIVLSDKDPLCVQVESHKYIYSGRFDRDLQHGHMRYDSYAYDVLAMG